MSRRWKALIGLIVLLALMLAAAWLSHDGSLAAWFGGRHGMVGASTFSGSIKARESVPGFEPLRSRVVELPFDEGKRLTRATVIARVGDDVDTGANGEIRAITDIAGLPVATQAG